jgi:uncharacterized Rossmann fold enzyme
MDYKKWEPIYKKIIEDFKFQVKRDEEAANILDDLLRNKNVLSTKYLKKTIENKEIFVFGAGPSLQKSIYKHHEKFLDKIKISADGATTALIENDIIPDIVVTDLDGKISDLIKANDKGSIVIIHAHGDNIDKIKKYVQEFKGRILGSTQTNPKPYSNVYNFGGFTDGDRAAYLADHLHAKNISLLGFDFNNKIGRYSFSENKDIKQKILKLRWCKNLINLLDKNNILFL